MFFFKYQFKYFCTTSFRLSINLQVYSCSMWMFWVLNKPFILLRKKDKLPAETHSVDFKLEYGEAPIELHKDSIEKGEKILVIDDLIATGGTAEAAAKLIEISGGKVAGFIFVINLFDLPGNNLLKSKGYKTESLIEFPGH